MARCAAPPPSFSFEQRQACRSTSVLGQLKYRRKAILWQDKSRSGLFMHGSVHLDDEMPPWPGAGVQLSEGEMDRDTGEITRGRKRRELERRMKKAGRRPECSSEVRLRRVPPPPPPPA